MDRQILLHFVRIEDELRFQREVMIEGFGANDNRFEAVGKLFEVDHCLGDHSDPY